jgi:hypothetical protein
MVKISCSLDGRAAEFPVEHATKSISEKLSKGLGRLVPPILDAGDVSAYDQISRGERP